jgi:hypothetical protein
MQNDIYVFTTAVASILEEKQILRKGDLVGPVRAAGRNIRITAGLVGKCVVSG